MPRDEKRSARGGQSRLKEAPAKAKMTIAAGGHVRVKASIAGEPYSSDDVNAFIATATSAVSKDYRFFSPESAERFGLLYRIGWAVQDHRRRFREERNPLYVWHAIAILTAPDGRETISGNGARIGELRRALDSGTPNVWPIDVLRELEIREWIGDPLPDWIADYLAAASTSLVDMEPGSGNSYGTDVAQALNLSTPGGGRSAHSKLQDPTDRIRRRALRFIAEIEKLGGKIGNAEVAEIFNVSIDTVKSWKRKTV